MESAFFSSRCIANTLPKNIPVIGQHIRILTELCKGFDGDRNRHIMLQAQIAGDQTDPVTQSGDSFLFQIHRQKDIAFADTGSLY